MADLEAFYDAFILVLLYVGDTHPIMLPSKVIIIFRQSRQLPVDR